MPRESRGEEEGGEVVRIWEEGVGVGVVVVVGVGAWDEIEDSNGNGV